MEHLHVSSTRAVRLSCTCLVHRDPENEGRGLLPTQSRRASHGLSRLILRVGKTDRREGSPDARAGILKQFKYALVWGTSVKHRPQKVGQEHVLQDEDIVQARPRARPPPAPCWAGAAPAA